MSDADDAERTFREGFTELVRDRPAVGPIDLAAITAQETTPSRRSSPLRWVAVAAALVLIAGAGWGIWFGLQSDKGRQAVPAGPASSAAELLNATWLLTQIEGQPAFPDATGHVPSLTFGPGSKGTGQDPCNGMSFRYRAEGSGLALSDVISTNMSCGSKPVFGQQGAYAHGLATTRSFSRQGQTLTLLGPGGTPLLVFRAKVNLPPTDHVLIRIRSELPVGIKRATVFVAKATMRYGPLSPDDDSDYVAAPGAYSYAAVTLVTTDDDDFSYKPADYTGETPLPPGRYTYVLSPSRTTKPGDRYLAIRLEADQ